MKNLILWLLLFPFSSMGSFAGLSGKSVRTLNGRSGIVYLTKADVALNKALEMEMVEFTFPREYAFEEKIELADIPAGARVMRIYISEVPMGEQMPNLSATLGTTANLEAFGGYGAFSAMGFTSNPIGYKEVLATKLTATVKDTFNGETSTTQLSGKTVKIFIEYVQE